MNKENLAKVKQIFYSALNVSPAERGDFVRNSSGDNFAVQAEVEKLLKSYESNTFDEKYFDSAEAGKVENLREGQHLGHYEIVRKIGAGGMGEVWLAKDENLGRETAIKVLYADLTEDKERMRRFVQEARAISLLNHPNILTIYEIGQDNGINYIAAEYINGETLGEKLKKHSFTAAETLDIAAQIVSALCAAHKNGIVHRDIKPENIMIRSDGLVKVLDFGLAKLIEDESDKSQDETVLNTTPGMILGTISYMSPEQIRGETADARSDIWSFGIIFYEMLTGRKPFSGRTAGDIIADTLRTEVSFPPEAVHRNLFEVEKIINKTLAKKRSERYQTSEELLNDLRQAEKRFEVENELEKSGAGFFTNTQKRKSSSSLKYFVAAVIVVSLLMLGLYFAKDRIFSARKTLERVDIKSLTTSGNITDAVISPDGKLLAFAKRDKNGQSLWIRQKMLGTSEIKLAESSAENLLSGLSFTPDGESIYFLQRPRNSSINTLYSVPILGGQPPKSIIEDVDSAAHFSPDGKRFVFMRRNIQLGVTSMIIADENGANPKTLIEGKSPEGLMLRPITWSSDGKNVYCVSEGLIAGSNATFRKVAAVNTETGEKQILSDRNWREFDSMADAEKFGGIIFSASDVQTPLQYQLWYLPLNGGQIVSLTNDAAIYGNISVAAATGEIIARQTQLETHVWIVDTAHPAAAPRRVSPNNSDGGSGITWAANGDLVYTSTLNGVNSLQRLPAGGGNAVTLTTGDYALSQPCGTSDGRYFVYNSTLENSMNLWRIDADGGNLKRLTPQHGEFTDCSPDGKIVYFNAVREGGHSSIWKISIDGGEPKRVTTRISLRPQVSPDGKTLACFYRADAKAAWQIGILSLGEDRVLKTIDLPKTVQLNTSYEWTKDGKNLVFIETADGIANLWQYPLDGGRPVKLTNFAEENLPLIANFAISPDGSKIAVVRGRRTGDIVQINPDPIK